MSRVLVTGAGGFIGRHTLAPLAAAGFEVHAVTSSRPPADAPAGVLWHHADLLAPGDAAALVREVRPACLLHLAWYTRPGAYWTTAENLDWVAASLRLLRAFGEAGGRRAVVAGTCAEYAWAPRTHCVEERPSAAGTPTVPATLYGAAKCGLRMIADAWALQVGAALAWGRIFNVYGPAEHPDRLVASLARALLRGEPAAAPDEGKVRDYVYAPDLGAAFAALLASDVVGPVNMASGAPVRLAEVVAATAVATGRADLVRRDPPRADLGRPGAPAIGKEEPVEITADVLRLSTEVGWTPSFELRDGVARTVEWWRRALAAESSGAAPPVPLAAEAVR
jgi:nucleoside-diphosphate-sugar epimerase